MYEYYCNQCLFLKILNIETLTSLLCVCKNMKISYLIFINKLISDFAETFCSKRVTMMFIENIFNMIIQPDAIIKYKKSLLKYKKRVIYMYNILEILA